VTPGAAALSLGSGGGGGIYATAPVLTGGAAAAGPARSASGGAGASGGGAPCVHEPFCAAGRCEVPSVDAPAPCSRHVLAFLDGGSRLFETLRRASPSQPDSQLALRCNLLLNVLTGTLPDLDDDVSLFDDCPRQLILAAFATAVDCCAHAAQLESLAEAAAYRTRVCQRIVDTLREAKAGGGATAAGVGGGVGGGSSGNSGVAGYVKRCHVPRGGGVEIEFVRVDEAQAVVPRQPGDSDDDEDNNDQHSNNNNNNHNNHSGGGGGGGGGSATDRLSSIAVHLEAFVTAQVALATSAAAAGAGRPVLRVAICGGKLAAYLVLNGYLELMRHSPALVAAFDFRFFPIPWGAATDSDHVAQFLATYDGWYRHHVQTMASPRPTAPHLSPLDTGSLPKKALAQLGLAEDGGGGPNVRTPVHTWMDEVDNYLREAAVTCRISVFQAQLFRTHPDMPTFSALTEPTVGWLCGIRVGRAIDCDPSSRAKLRYSLAPLEMSVKWQEVAPGGHGRSGPGAAQVAERYTVTKRFYTSIDIRNLPDPEDRRGPVPDPRSALLDVTFRECVAAGGGTLKKGAPAGKFRTVHHSARVSFIELEAGEPFAVVADGVHLGEFFKVRIQPYGGRAANVAFPVQSFLPLHV
jgi:hypothetical protein